MTTKSDLNFTINNFNKYNEAGFKITFDRPYGKVKYLLIKNKNSNKYNHKLNFKTFNEAVIAIDFLDIALKVKGGSLS